MSYGLKLWDSGGNAKLEITDRITRYYGQYSAVFNSTGVESPQYISVPEMSEDGTWFVASSHAYIAVFVETGRIRVEKMYPYSTSSTAILIFRS